MCYTIDDRNRMQKAAEFLKLAANLHYQVGGSECVGIGEQIEPILETLILVLDDSEPSDERNLP